MTNKTTLNTAIMIHAIRASTESSRRRVLELTAISYAEHAAP